MNQHDIDILRPLAQRYHELANDPVNEERMKRARSNNDLKPVRPLVLIAEVPWHEMNFDGSLTLQCEDPNARGMEDFFRKTIYQWEHFQVDMFLYDAYYVSKAYDDSGIGMGVSERSETSDEKNNIYSHYYIDQLDSEEKLELLHAPVITARPDLDAMRVQKAQEAFGDILPVRTRGDFLYFAPWDKIVRLHGVENSLCDLAAEPEFMHAVIKRFAEIYMARVDSMNEQHLFDNDVPHVHCTPGLSDDLDALAAQGLAGTSGCTWFRSMAQSFSTISPKMHDEFDIQYTIPLAKKFGLTYYGCCEPLYDRLDIITKIPNLRKIGVSAWSNMEVSAEFMGSNYVFSRKPNPAQVAVSVDEDVVRKDISRAIEVCQKYNCPCDITLKDISTVSYKPENLFKWAKIAEETIDRYY